MLCEPATNADGCECRLLMRLQNVERDAGESATSMDRVLQGFQMYTQVQPDSSFSFDLLHYKVPENLSQHLSSRFVQA